MTSPATEPSVKALGVTTVPTLLAATSTVVPVTLRPSLPDMCFIPYASMLASVSLQDLRINGVAIISEDTVHVDVSNVGLLTLSGASIMVHAVA
jgi:hypothetical protein